MKLQSVQKRRCHPLKRILPIAIAGALCTPFGAFAQSTVTLYGVIDEGIDYTNNVRGSSNVELASGLSSGGRFGLKGSEDLGGGLKTIFVLENGFDVNTGRLNQGGRMFGRQAYVGMTTDHFGTVTAGRQYDPLVDLLGPMTANGNWAGSFLSHPYDNDNTDNSFRVNNSIKYTSTNYAGFTFEGMYGLSNQAGGFANNRLYSVAAQYTGGALTVVGAYLQVNNPGATQVGAVATDDANFFAGRTQVYGIGINYAVTQAATLGFVYTRSNNRDVTSNAYVGKLVNPASSLNFDNYEISGKYQFTSSLYAGLMVSYTVGHFDSNAGNSRPKWGEVGGMADYNFSKRSDVYVQAAWQHASSGGAVSAPFNTAFIVGADGPSSTSNQFVARVAFRHTF